MSQHHAKFTWGAGPNSVHIAGNFNNWSGTATPLTKQPDGSFAADVPVPWGEKQAFKYVVDGEWKVREDEAKEWDAAGNMNNVYTAPHPPTPAATSNSTSAPSAAAAVLPSTTETKAETKEAQAEEAVVPTTTAVPASTVDDTPAPVKSEPTKPSTLLASSAPGAASSGSAPILGGVFLGQPVAPVTASVPASVTAAEPVKATAAVPIEAAPVTSDPTPVQIEKAAANANIGEAPVNGEHHTFQEQIAEYGAGALGAIGAALGGAVIAVEKATGIDLAHGNPLSVDEAKAKGIDIKTLDQTELGTDAVSPVGTKPPASAVAALEEKTRELKLDSGVGASAPKEQASLPLPNGEAPKSSYANKPEPIGHQANEPIKHDIPAQNETTDNHKSVPAPVIVPVSAKDPKKDRTLDATTNKDTAGTKPIDNNPAVSASQAKKEAERNPAGSASTPAVAQGVATPAPASATSNIKAGETTARPDAPATNLHVSSPPTPPKDITSPVAPATPAKTAPSATSTPVKPAVGSISATSTPASTPAKSAHTKETTGGSDIRKRKSSFFHKIKHAFSPKDKEKK